MCCDELDFSLICYDTLCIACALLDLGFFAPHPDFLLVHCSAIACCIDLPLRVYALLTIDILYDNVPKAKKDGPPLGF